MKIIRSKPAKGKPPKIICTGCGKRAREAGVAVPDDAVGKIVGPDVVHGPDEPLKVGAIIDEDDIQPLCEDCLAVLERAEMR